MKENKFYRESINSIKMSSRHNVLKVHSQNSYEHEKTKFDIVYLLRKQGVNLATEVEFKNGGRGDILNLDEAVVYEVLHSETIEQFKSKKQLYPSFLTVIPVRTSTTLIELKALLGGF